MRALQEMEEALKGISDPDLVPIMKEASRCYGIGSYRGCIGLCYLALIQTLPQWLFGHGTGKAKGGDIFRHMALMTFQDSGRPAAEPNFLHNNSVLSREELQALESMRELGNRVLDPSPSAITAQDAQRAYKTTINGFLSKPRPDGFEAGWL